MYAARLVESGTADVVFGRALHPYARGLLSAVPRLDRGRSAKLATIDGAPPNLLAPPEGCRFRPRCRFAIDKCQEVPPLEAVERGHLVACFRKHEMRGARSRPAAAATTRTRRRASGDGTPILDIRGRQQVLPRARRLPAPAQAGARRQRRHARYQARRDAGPGRRIGLRQVHARPRWCCGSTSRPPARSASTASTSRSCKRSEMFAVRKKMQVIFQDPYSSLNPRMTVGQIIAEPMYVHEILPAGQDPAARGRAAAAGRPLPLHGRCAIRTSCRAASASASASPGRWRSSRA